MTAEYWARVAYWVVLYATVGRLVGEMAAEAAKRRARSRWRQ